MFALEHGLDATDLDDLSETVRAAVAQGFGIKYRKWWLPFVVYAAELGYGYVGGEYWQTFDDETPRWDEVGDRDWIGYQFKKFADEYGGLRPRGAFARHRSIIAWPIVHAVLPVYLQRNLAQLLFEFRTALTSELLNDPETLGARLASRTGQYTERFRIFSENTALLGSVAAALLGEGDESPYLLPSTQRRLVESLSRESESRRWLTSARQVASRVRAKGFRSSGKSASASAAPAAGRVSPPQPTDPKLQLRRDDGQWQLYAALPDLTPIGARLPEVVEELRGRRAIVDGVEGAPLARGRLLFPGQSVRLARWPRPEAPFVQLVGAPEHVNHLLADQCVVRGRPVWLFRQRMRGLADEIKRRVVRPGQTYIVIQGQSAPTPGMPWSEETALDISGMRAFVLRITATRRRRTGSAKLWHSPRRCSDLWLRRDGKLAPARAEPSGRVKQPRANAPQLRRARRLGARYLGFLAADDVNRPRVFSLGIRFSTYALTVGISEGGTTSRFRLGKRVRQSYVDGVDESLVRVELGDNTRSLY